MNLWSSVRFIAFDMGMLMPRSSIISAMISRSLGHTEVSRENTHSRQNYPATPRLRVVTEEPLKSMFKEPLRIGPQEAEKLEALNSTGRVDFVLQVQR
jgi:hypothetical protein